MSYDTEEQQVQRLKEWWSENGTPLIVGAVLGLSGFLGWKFWEEKQIAYQQAASDLYIKMTDILESEDKANLKSSAEAVKKNFPDSSYAILSAFQLAKMAIEEEQLDQAATELTWVVDTHSDNELVSIAKIRLARILIAQDKASQALPLVEFDTDSGYYALASLVKGDALIMLDKKTEALVAYNVAIGNQELASRNPTLQHKIDALTAPDEVFALQTTSAQSNEDASISAPSIEQVSEEIQEVQEMPETSTEEPAEETK